MCIRLYISIQYENRNSNYNETKKKLFFKCITLYQRLKSWICCFPVSFMFVNMFQCCSITETLKQVIEKKIERNRPIYLMFIDLQKAYDNIPISKLWEVLQNTNINHTLIKACLLYTSRCV